MVRDKSTNKSRGFGFVSLKDPDDYLKAMKEMNVSGVWGLGADAGPSCSHRPPHAPPGKYVGNRPIKCRKSTYKERNIGEVKKREKKKKMGLSV